MSNKEFTKEELTQIFKEIKQENQDHGYVPPQAIDSQCTRCKEKTPTEQEKNPHIMTCKAYPNGIPLRIVINEVPCKEFKQK